MPHAEAQATHTVTDAKAKATYTVTDAMARALELAARGPVTGANPRVGCVILSPAGEILAEGWHRGVGTPHAEVDALSQLTPEAATGSTAVVTLEPCDHTGRTGPCSRALIAAGVSHVVYAVDDPGEESGGGSRRLADAGIIVEAGVLSDRAEELLRVWLTAMRAGRPYVTVKWAASLDGRAAAEDGSSQWITGDAARLRVHQQRAVADAIAVGTGTVLDDDPSLTVRDAAGATLPEQPLPVVFGERGIPVGARLHRHPRGVLETGSRNIHAVLGDLHERGIRHLFVEGGPTLASAFIAAGLVDEYLIYLAPTLLGGPRFAVGDLGVNTLGEAKALRIASVEQLGADLLITAHPAPKGTT